MKSSANVSDLRQSRRLEIMNGSKSCGPPGGPEAPSANRRRPRLRASCSPSPRPFSWYVFSVQRRLVAQICNLPYRRFIIGTASGNSSALALADVPQNAILRYSRLQICATLTTYSPRGDGGTFAHALVIRPSLLLGYLQDESQRSGDRNRNPPSFPAPCQRSPSPQGEGRGEGEGSKLHQAHNTRRNC